MARFPFVIALEVVAAANGLIQASYIVPSGETYEITDLIWNATGAFNIIGIRSSQSLYHTNASQDNPIPSSHLKQVEQLYNFLNPFAIPMIVNPTNSLIFDIQDTSGGSNTINLSLAAIRITQ